MYIRCDCITDVIHVSLLRIVNFEIFAIFNELYENLPFRFKKSAQKSKLCLYNSA